MQPTSTMPAARTGKTRPIVIILLAIVLAAALAGGGLYYFGAFSTEIATEAYDSPGTDPFGPSVGDGMSVPITPVAQISQAVPATQAAAPGVPPAPVSPPTPAPGGGTSVSGGTPGLYGGTNQNACDPQKLVAFLQANPDKARAWATVEGITPEQIPAYVAGLTPVFLRTDTAVINHGFRNGVANPINSVLQAGTAVMVDKAGVPRVRCRCGNPLLPPKQFSRVRYSGVKWLGFDERNITYIQRSTTVVNVFVVHVFCDCPPAVYQVCQDPNGCRTAPGSPPPAAATVPPRPTKPSGRAPYPPCRDGSAESGLPCTSATPQPPDAASGSGGGGGDTPNTGGGGGTPSGGGGGTPSGGGGAPNAGGGDKPKPPTVPDGQGPDAESYG